MNFNNIINEIAKADPEVFERTSERRDIIRRWGKGIALTAMPLALGSLLKKAYGQSTSGIVDVLNFALTLEYLEKEFYQIALASNNLITDPVSRVAIQTIYDHEALHVDALIATINGLEAGAAVAKPNFKFDVGPFTTVFTNYDVFLAVAQALEDTGVRAYKGQAAALISNNGILTAALNIHSVEARHAAHIRKMRKAQGVNVKPWITGKSSGITGTAGAAVEPVYEGEQETTQAGVNIIGIANPFNVTISSNAASESFDEPLDKQTVLAIASTFIVQ